MCVEGGRGDAFLLACCARIRRSGEQSCGASLILLPSIGQAAYMLGDKFTFMSNSISDEPHITVVITRDRAITFS